MRIKWECSECEKVNETDMNHWRAVKDGQGFIAMCQSCHLEIEVDIEVNTRTR